MSPVECHAICVESAFVRALRTVCPGKYAPELLEFYAIAVDALPRSRVRI